ncbi:MAG: serine hydrolase [Isosphaeraceae bacterium]
MRAKTRPAIALLVPFALFTSSGTTLAQNGPGDAPAPTLESRLSPLIQAHQGKVTLAVKNLDTGESFAVLPDEPMPTASLIKVAVMVEAYRQAAEKTLDLARPVTLRETDKVPGSGILTGHFSEGASFPLVDAVHLMIAFSDNTATNLVLDQIGLKATAESMEAMGYPNTKIHSKVFRRDTSVFPERSQRFGLGSTTAAEMVRLFEALWRKEVVSPEASEAMLKHLRACDDKNKFPRFLPPGTRIAFKTGSVDASRTAAGVVECPAGPVALCVMTAENQDKRYVADSAGDRLCAEIAREVHRHFGATKVNQDKDKDKGPVAPTSPPGGETD